MLSSKEETQVDAHVRKEKHPGELLELSKCEVTSRSEGSGLGREEGGGRKLHLGRGMEKTRSLGLSSLCAGGCGEVPSAAGAPLPVSVGGGPSRVDPDLAHACL